MSGREHEFGVVIPAPDAMSDLDIDAIEQRANAATEGPWVPVKLDRESDWRDIQTLDGESVAAGGLVGEGDGYGCACSPTDAEFISHARTDIPELVARVRELEAALRALQVAANERCDCDSVFTPQGLHRSLCPVRVLHSLTLAPAGANADAARALGGHP